MPRRRLIGLPALILWGTTLAGAQPTPATAAQRWLPWLGCWQLVEETGAWDAEPGDPRQVADRVVVCVAPGDGAGVTVTTLADGTPVLVETLTGDGVEHPVDEAACDGWRRSSWSSDGARLFTRAELTCDGAVRRVSGLGLMADDRTWLDLQFVDTGDRGAVTVRRYRRAGPATVTAAGAVPLGDDLREQVRAAAGRIASSPIGIDDVIEAGRAVEPAVVETMLVETGASFALDGRTLLRLDDSDVPSQVIDLMVALSFPEAFALERSSGGGGTTAGGGIADPYAFGSWYPYYASPFGYYYGWSPYDSLYYFGPATSYVLLPDAETGPTARAYEGRGYTRIDRREPPSDRRARRRGDGDGSTPEASRRGGDSGGGGSRATPGGYRGGAPSGRTARPR